MNKRDAAKARWANEEYRKKTIEAMKGKSPGNTSPRSEETRKKAQASNPNKKKVYQFTLDGEFIAEYPSQKEASKQTGVAQSVIGQFLKERNRNHKEKGYIWSYERDNVPKTPPRKIYELKRDHPTEEVLEKIHAESLPNGPAEVTQYDYEGNVIARYATLGDAGRMNGFDTAAISNCCRRKRDTAYGYIWAYTRK